MIGILLVTHGTLAGSLLQTATMILGAPPGVVSIEIHPGEGRDDLEPRIGQAIHELDTGDGVVILTDIVGGSPFQAGIVARGERKIPVLTGVNLPMLIECLMGRNGKSRGDIPDWVKSVQQAAKKGIQEA
jgi:mannose/fructose/sorbose-specific phosphotransferase system IIA component